MSPETVFVLTFIGVFTLTLGTALGILYLGVSLMEALF